MIVAAFLSNTIPFFVLQIEAKIVRKWPESPIDIDIEKVYYFLSIAAHCPCIVLVIASSRHSAASTL
jgi:hypothetical protein